MFKRISTVALGALFALGLSGPIAVHAATSPTLVGASGYSVLGGAAVTNTGTTTASGAVGVSPDTSITGQATLTAGGGIHSNDASAIAAQADRLSAFTALDQTCDQTFGAVDLTATFPSGVGPGVYCSTSSFSLTGGLNLIGSGVWIFKTATTLITSPGSSVTGGDACNVWWRIGSAATLDTTTSFLGNIVTGNDADTTALKTGATLNGRVLGGTGQTVTLAGNTITAPTCTAAVAAVAAVVASSGSGDNDKRGKGDHGNGNPKKKTPKLPVAGVTPEEKNTLWNSIALVGVLMFVSTSLVVVTRKHTI